MTNTPDFAMFTDEGNARLHSAIDAFLRQGEFSLNLWKVYDDLMEFLANADELTNYREWRDTEVRASIREYLEQVFRQRKFRML
jgi:hypothetical protein